MKVIWRLACLEGFRIDATTGGLESFHTQARCPFTEGRGREGGNEVFPNGGTGIAADEAVERLAVREVEAAFSGDEKFPANRRFAVEKCDLQTRFRSHFRRAKTGRAAADDGELGMAVQGAEVMGMVRDVNLQQSPARGREAHV